MSRRKFTPTHRITHNGRGILVQVTTDRGLFGPAYTRSEWETGTAADWEFVPCDVEDATGNEATIAMFLFQGQPPTGAFSYETLVQP